MDKEIENLIKMRRSFCLDYLESDYDKRMYMSAVLKTLRHLELINRDEYAKEMRCMFDEFNLREF